MRFNSLPLPLVSLSAADRIPAPITEDRREVLATIEKLMSDPSMA